MTTQIRQRNPERGKMSDAVQNSAVRARRFGVEGKFTIGELEMLLQHQNRQCAYCGADMGNTRWTVDHVVPMCKGGLNVASNLTLCCFQCNHAKADRTPDQWKH